MKSKLETLLDEEYPETEISHIQRQAFIKGYNAAKAETNTESDKRQALQYLNSRKPIDDAKF